LTTWSPKLPGYNKLTTTITRQELNKHYNNMASVAAQSPSQTGKAAEMFSQLFAGQLEAMARHMATQFNIDTEEAVKMATEHAATLDLQSMEKPKRRRAAGTRKPKAPVTAEHRCMARVWASGSGNDQCKCARIDGAEFCSRHAKQAAICEKACQVNDNGKKLGLFCGRIDEFIPGTQLAPFASDGIIRIEWKSQGHLEAIADALENETCRKQTISRKSKKKAAPVVVEMSEDELVAAVTNTEDKTENDTLSPHNEVVTADTFAAFGLAADGDEDADEDSLDVEEWEHNGESYLVCRETLVIYNEEGEEVGKWDEGVTEGAPVPEDE
jgi:hypothetical protein